MSEPRYMIPAPKKLLLCTLLFPLFCAWNAAAQSPHDWLELMVGANKKFNYQGTLVHMCDGTMDIVRIVHRVENGQVTERITARSSDGRQIIRSVDEVMCILPDQKKVIVERGKPLSSPIGAQMANFPSFANVSKLLYEITMLGSDRVADQDTVVLAIRPVDKHRYGYRLWLDHRTALPLKFELVDSEGLGLEQGMFTEIQFSESIPAQDVEPTIATEEFEWQKSAAVSDSSSGGAQQEPSERLSSKWRTVRLPPGFELVLAEAKIADGAGGSMEQLVYSDGLATISVFIEIPAGDVETVGGTSKVGATNAFTTLREGYLITAMGGVPLDTARMVALSTVLR